MSGIPLPAPTASTDLGPFAREPYRVMLCCSACTSASFMLNTRPCHGGCSSALMDDGASYRVIAAPGWYSFHRTLTDDFTTLTMLVQVIGSTATLVQITPDLPWAIGYVDLTHGYSVYVFVGRAPGSLATPCHFRPAPFADPCPCARPPSPVSVPICRPPQATLTICGAGCPNVIAVDLPCPADNVGGQCRGQCSMLIAGVTHTPDPAVLIAVLRPVNIGANDAPVVIRLTDRLCSEISADTAGDDFGIVFESSCPGMTYIVLTQTSDLAVVTISTFSMLTGDEVTGVSVRYLGRTGLPLFSDPCCALTLYNVCIHYTAGEVYGPDVTVIAQVVWDDADPCEAPCVDSDGGTCRPLILRSNVCCEAFNTIYLYVDVSDEQQIVDFLTNPDVYECGVASRDRTPSTRALFPSPIPYTLFQFVPPPPPGPGPCPAPAEDMADGVLYTAKIVGADTNSIRVLYPSGLAPGASTNVEGAVLTVSSMTISPGIPVVLVWQRGGTYAFYDAAHGDVITSNITAVITGDFVSSDMGQASPLRAYVSDNAGGTVLTSIVVTSEDELAGSPYLQGFALVIGLHPNGWWVKPASGDLAAVVDSSGLVALTTSLADVPISSFTVEDSGVVILGTFVAGNGVCFTLLALTTDAIPFTSLTIRQGAFASNGSTVFPPCCLEATVTAVGTFDIPAGTVLALAIDPTSVLDPVMWRSESPGSSTWVEITDCSVSVAQPPLWAAQDPIALQIYVQVLSGLESYEAFSALGAPWRVTGNPDATCTLGDPDDLQSYMPYFGSSAQQLPLSVIGQSTSTYLRGTISVPSYADLATAVAAAPADMWSDAPSVDPNMPDMPLLVQSLQPGAVVLTGVWRDATRLVIAFVATTTISASTPLSFTFVRWPDATTEQVTFTLGAAIATGELTVASIVYGADPSANELLAVASNRSTTVIPTSVLSNAGSMQDPYVTNSFLTLYSGSDEVAGTSMTTTLPFTQGNTLPPGLEVNITALERSSFYYNRPAAGDAWVARVGIANDPTTNTFNVFDWQTVSGFVYTDACITVFTPTSLSDFLAALLWFVTV